ncbi:MAG: lycopene cyclase domain-containing protein [Patiriisocius sp.]|jgi:lycopene cyclase domain-containing protein
MLRNVVCSNKILQGEINFMKGLTYLAIDLGCILIPFSASFYPKHPFYKEWKYFFPANLIVAILFLIWDYFFTKAGFWGFNPDYLTGIYLANLPIEEVLFFIAIPYACTFTYFALQYIPIVNPFSKIELPLNALFALSMLFAGLTFLGKWYTSLTFLLLGWYLLVALFTKRKMASIYLSYILILPFFFISNGILTGYITPEPIVWYNHAENLNFRLGSIPIEDVFYGFLLIVWNIHLYEYLKKRANKDLA